MGNQQTREARAAGSSDTPGAHNRLTRRVASLGSSRQDQDQSRNRISRADIFGASAHSNAAAAAHDRDASAAGSAAPRPEPTGDAPFQRKETRQEREARRREKQAALRLAERERSLRTEGVDGGYLVTLGTYTGVEDFSKSAVRHLQIERRLAPFWRGLEDFADTWTDYQLVSAIRGLPVPADDAQPPEGFFEPTPPHPSSPDTPGSPPANLLEAPPPPGAGASSSQDAQTPSSAPPRSSSPFRPRGARAIVAALNLGSSRNPSEVNISPPREAMLPPDPYIDGRPFEAVLYRNATECPICFLSYPPFLNHTRCCSQPICSECFVQIKRPDPHLPEHHPGEGDATAGADGGAGADAEAELELESEPSTCPYCQQSEFGVTYEPPPFRRGLVHSSGSSFDGLASPVPSHAMSSQSSLTSSPKQGPRRRTHSLSANAPNVVSTDRIRPDWETKLMTARALRARRAAAATALHTAAFMTHQSNGWGRLFRRTAEGGSSSNRHHHQSNNSNNNNITTTTQADVNPGLNRLEEFENLLVAEGIRQSLASKEQEDRKEAKKKEKEERKAREKAEREERKAREQAEKEERKALKQQQQQQQRGIYGSGAPGLGASRSSLSLPFGRKRGNSAASIIPRGVGLPTPGEAEEGHQQQHPDQQHADQQPSAPSTSASASRPVVDKGKAPERPVSHLRHFNTTSSMQSVQSPSQESQSDGNQSGGDGDGEGLFNYRSMAEGLGLDIDTGKIIESSDESRAQEVKEDADADADVSVSVATLKPPELVVTPDSPVGGGEDGDKMFGLGPVTHIESRKIS